MREEYEQMELDTRSRLNVALEMVTKDTIQTALEMIQEHHRQAALENQTAPTFVRNRHEAYGIAAEQLIKINTAVKTIKDDVARLLGTLSDPNFPAVEVTSSIVNSTSAAACILISAAAEMRRTLDNLYMAEISSSDGPTPIEGWMENAEFQEAESADASESNNEMEDN